MILCTETNKICRETFDFHLHDFCEVAESAKIKFW